MNFAPEMQVKQFVAVAQNGRGQRFQVFTTGSTKHYLFVPLARDGTSGTLMIPVLKADLRDDIRRMLGHGCGNCTL